MFQWLFGSKKSRQPSQSPTEKKQKKQQKKQKWVQQALLQFLMSKQWRITLLNFVDNNCMVFDSEEENKFQYTSIHYKFKSLVAGLFDSVMDDIGIDSKTLVLEIGKGLEGKNRKVFEQLLYVEDFLMFKGMMLKRNVELEKEALKEIGGMGKGKKIQGGGQNGGGKTGRSDNEIMKQILKISKMEEEERRRKEEKMREEEERMIEQEEREFQRAIEQSSRLKQIEEQQALKRQKSKQKSHLPKKLQQPSQQQNLQNQKQSKLSKQQQMQKKLQILKQKKEKLQLDKKNSEIKLLKYQQNMRQNMGKKQQQPLPKITHQQHVLQQLKLNEQNPNNVTLNHPTKQDIEERKQKLAEYRDMLRKKKTEERNFEMNSTINPKSQMDSILFAEGGVIYHSTVALSNENSQVKVSQNEIDRRKELMKRIKNKIVEEY